LSTWGFQRNMAMEMQELLYYCVEVRVRRPYSVIVPFLCQQCGSCCREIGITWGRRMIEKASAFLGLAPRKFTATYLKVPVRHGDRETLKIGGRKVHPCPLLTDKGECRIHPARPDACRDFPVRADSPSSGVECPGLIRMQAVARRLTHRIPHSQVDRSPPHDIETLYRSRTYLRPNGQQKRVIHRKYLTTNPSDEERILFIRLNGLEHLE
jgi:Fe-S-cluster containining protein